MLPGSAAAPCPTCFVALPFSETGLARISASSHCPARTRGGWHARSIRLAVRRDLRSRVRGSTGGARRLADPRRDQIERPGAGDDTRAWGPAVPQGRGRRRTRAKPAYYLVVQPRQAVRRGRFHDRRRGQRIVRDLAQQADVLVENYKVGGLAKYGLDYASVAALNPRLVYASITGFGQNGPYARPRRLRLHHPGDVGIHERHRRARRPARRRSAEGGHRDHRPDDRNVRHGGDPGGARASRPHRRRASGSTPASSTRPSR